MCRRRRNFTIGFDKAWQVAKPMRFRVTGLNGIQKLNCDRHRIFVNVREDGTGWLQGPRGGHLKPCAPRYSYVEIFVDRRWRTLVIEQDWPFDRDAYRLRFWRPIVRVKAGRRYVGIAPKRT
jgi:hypothetical protein